MTPLSEATLTLLFTGGVSLRSWHEIGTLDRELELYRRIAPSLRRLNVVTYGGARDATFARHLGDLRLLPSLWFPRRFPSWLNRAALRLAHGDVLRETTVVKTNQIPGSEIGLWLKQHYGCRLITRCGYLFSLNVERQSSDPETIRRARELERKAFQEADLGVLTTEANLKHVVERHGVDSRKLRVVPNYVDVEQFRPRPPGFECPSEPSLIFIGRLAPEKNLASLLAALAILKSREGKVPDLAVVGSGPLADPLREKAKSLGLRVSFRGNLDNAALPELLWRAGVFVLPSLYEGHPKALLEAMSCGMACIASDVEGVRELLQHRESGYLCRPEPASIAESLQIVLRDGALRARLGEKAHRFVLENCSLRRVVSKELEVLRESLA